MLRARAIIVTITSCRSMLCRGSHASSRFDLGQIAREWRGAPFSARHRDNAVVRCSVRLCAKALRLAGMAYGVPEAEYRRLLGPALIRRNG